MLPFSIPFRRTILDEGRPLLETVARFIAFGSGTSASIASANHFSNCAIGPGNTFEVSSVALVYSVRNCSRDCMLFFPIYRKDGDFLTSFPAPGIKFSTFAWRYSESLVY